MGVKHEERNGNQKSTVTRLCCVSNSRHSQCCILVVSVSVFCFPFFYDNAVCVFVCCVVFVCVCVLL